MFAAVERLMSDKFLERRWPTDVGLGLELLDHAVQAVLMWRAYRQKL